MKKINFYLSILTLVILGTSCEDPEAVVHPPNADQSLVYFETNSANLPVALDEDGSVTVNVLATSVTPEPRTISIMLNEDQSDLSEGDLTYPSQVTIPANEYGTDFTISLEDGDNVTTAQQSLVFDLVDSGDESIAINGANSSLNVSFFQVCPIPANYLVGTYAIQDVDAVVGPDNGTENFASGTVNIVASSSNTRTFTVGILPAFAGDRDVTLNLICNTFVLETVVPNLTCNGDDSYIFTDLADGNTYDLADDTEFLIQYTEDPEGSCGGPFISSFSLIKQ